MMRILVVWLAMLPFAVMLQLGFLDPNFFALEVQEWGKTCLSAPFSLA
jgi:hypothetical protein